MAMQPQMSEQAFNDAVDSRIDQRIDQRIASQIDQRIVGNEMVAFVQKQVVAVLQSGEFQQRLQAEMKPAMLEMQTTVERATTTAGQALHEAQQASADADRKIAEMSSLMSQLNDRLGTSSSELDRMRSAGNEAFRQHQELVSAARTANEAAASANEAQVKEVQAAMATALSTLDRVCGESQQKAEAHINEVGTLIVSRVQADIGHLKQEIGAGNTGAGGRARAHQLVSAKDCRVGKLSDDAKVSDFKHWAAQVELYLESMPGWKGSTKILRLIRRSAFSIDGHAQFAEVTANASDLGGGQVTNMYQD